MKKLVTFYDGTKEVVETYVDEADLNELERDGFIYIGTKVFRVSDIRKLETLEDDKVIKLLLTETEAYALLEQLKAYAPEKFPCGTMQVSDPASRDFISVPVNPEIKMKMGIYSKIEDGFKIANSHN